MVDYEKLYNELKTLVLENRNAINGINANAKKTEALGDASVPLAGSELVRIVQGGVSVNVEAENLRLNDEEVIEDITWTGLADKTDRKTGDRYNLTDTHIDPVLGNITGEILLQTPDMFYWEVDSVTYEKIIQ